MNNWDVTWGAWYPDPPEAQTAEAQTAAALETYRKMGVTYVEVSTAGDDNVCEACRAAEAYGSYPIDRPPRAAAVRRMSVRTSSRTRS
jgi:hypothetical protein